MSQEGSRSHAETGKVLGSVYGSLIVLLAATLLLSSVFSVLPTDATIRAFTLAWILGGFLILMGTELARSMYKSGITIVGFLGFLALNLLLVTFYLAVFADIVTPTTADYSIQMVVYLIIGSVVWYAVMLLWMFLKERE